MRGSSFGPRDTDAIDRSIEAAIGEALLRASRDGRHDVVAALVEELRARRLERERASRPANVIPLRPR